MCLVFPQGKVVKNKYLVPDPNYDNGDMKSVFNDMNGRVLED